MFDNDYIATKGDIKNNNRMLQREMSNIHNEISSLHDNLSYSLQQIQSENSRRMNELSESLNEQNKQFEELQKKLEKPIATKTNELRQRAIDSLNNGWIEEAKEDILEVLKLDKTDYIAHLILARIYLMLGKDLNSALEHYDLAIKYSGPYDKEFQKSVGIEKAEMFLNIARQFNKENNTEEAIKYYDLALNLLSEVKAYYKYIKIKIEKAEIYYSKGLIDNALKEMEDIENNFSKFDPEVYYYKALFLINLGKKDEAFENIKKYILNTLNTEKVLNTKEFESLKKEIENFIKETIESKLQEIQQLESLIADKIKILKKASFIYPSPKIDKKTNFQSYYEIIEYIKYLNNLIEEIESSKKYILCSIDETSLVKLLIDQIPDFFAGLFLLIKGVISIGLIGVAVFFSVGIVGLVIGWIINIDLIDKPIIFGSNIMELIIFITIGIMALSVFAFILIVIISIKNSIYKYRKIKKMKPKIENL